MADQLYGGGVNPLSEKQFSKLQKSIDWSQKQFEFSRRKRVEAIKQFCGSRYMESGSEKIMPVNISKLAVEIYVRQLAAHTPRVLITTKRDELRSTAANFELALNQIPNEIGLSRTLRIFVMEALFSVGILKIGLSDGEQIMGHNYGEVFVDNVTLDDYFCDMSTGSRNTIQYEGNDYWMDYDDVMEMDWAKKTSREKLKPDEYTMLGQDGEIRAESIANASTPEVFKDRIHMRDVWLPGEKLLVTYGVTSKKLLNVVEWEGPKNGPYVWLGYSDVPGNLLPLPPVSIWYDLNELANGLFRKLGNQADAQKTVQGFPGGDDAGVIAFKDAKDGDGIAYSGAKPEPLTAGGVDSKTLAFFLQTRELSSYFAGNLDSLGGLAPMTQTVGQDKLLGEAASAQLRDMADKTIDAIKEVFYALAWYEWRDPLKQRDLEKKVPGMGVSVPVKWNQESKQGEFDLYDLEIDVYSCQDDSPATKLQKLGLIVERFITPLSPFIQQQSGSIDVEAILDDVVKYSDMPEAGRYVTFMDDYTGQQGAPMGAAPTGAPASGADEAGGIPQPEPTGTADMMQELLSDSGE